MRQLFYLATPILIALAAALEMGFMNQQKSQTVSSPPTADTDTVTWHRPRFEEYREERHKLVQEGIEAYDITDSTVLNAMRHVPRHRFVPEGYRSRAYQNTALPIGHNQTISQPLVVAYMTGLLDIHPGENVLEIGTGSGYQAAVLSELTPHVYTIEIIEALGREARQTFEELGYHTIKTRIGDGYQGWPEYAPFDAIIITAAAGEVPQPLIDQLARGGRLVMPLRDQDERQYLIRITKNKNGKLRRERLMAVRFVPMTGEVQHR